VLSLSTRWGFASLRRLALKSVDPPTPFDQLLLARAYSIDDWVSPALTALCERTVPLSLSEARQMSVEDVVLITTVREGIRPHALQVDPDEIPNCIEAVQIGIQAGAGPGGARVLSSAASSSSSLSLMMMMEGANLKGETSTSPSGSTTASNGTGPPSARSTMAAGAKANDAGENVEEEEDAKTAVALSPIDGAVRRRAAKLNLKGDNTGAIAGENVSVRSSSRPTSVTSAWGKILVVPSPTLSHAPQSPQAWGLPADADEPPHEQPGWGVQWGGRGGKSPGRPSPPPVPPKPFGGQVWDSDGGGD